MALFSRRKNSDRPAAPEVPDEGGVADAVAPPVEPASDPAASVGISLSTFQGVGASQPPVPAPDPRPQARTVPAEAPAPNESLPGVYDNVLLRDALAALPDPPTPTTLMNVARQLLQGHL
jgi:hypothetical protein